MIEHKFKIGDKVVYTNDFGVCWGIETISELAQRTDGPTYHTLESDMPWFSVNERNYKLATQADLDAYERGDDDYFQRVHGFEPSDYFGCY